MPLIGTCRAPGTVGSLASSTVTFRFNAGPASRTPARLDSGRTVQTELVSAVTALRLNQSARGPMITRQREPAACWQRDRDVPPRSARALRARQRDGSWARQPDGETAERHFDRGRRRVVADEAIRPVKRFAIRRSGPPDAEVRIARATPVLDRGERAGRDDLDHAATNRTTRPGVRMAGGSRSVSHKVVSV